MRKRYCFLSICIIISMILGGCASIPSMTEEQTEVVSEYAASLLLKYDSQNHSRLVDTTKYMNQYLNAVAAYESAEKEYYDKLAYEEEKRKNEALNQKEEGEKYAANTGGSAYTGALSDGTGGATVVDGTLDATSVEAYLGLDNFSVAYSGYDILDSYPKDSNDDYFFSCVATPGNKLLVAYFDVTNLNSDVQKLDVFNKNARFKLNVNGNKRDTLMTLLEDSLSEYLGDFTGGESKKLVLIREISDDITVESLTMSVSLSGKNAMTNTLQ